ncbi:unnamed protein product [Parnassius apollo]|uniref:(apollo) hypothetical protein n=1 Tax=Parnassius apollo TaxID=110799 RepID=A0A8S3XTQ4_PARAO|nr:unnamed protein product [Parnassius apollo]
MEKYGFGLTRKEVLEVVGQYVVENNIETPFKNGTPGEDWFLAFKKRHNLSVKKPQPVEYARKKACNPAVIYPYFDLLAKTIDDLGLRDKPSHIWNADETSFSKDPSKSKVVGLRGYTSTRTISSPGKTNTTVLLACNAAGEKAPPLIVFKGKSVWDTWTSEDGYPGTRYAATSNGWMESSVFENFIQKIFLPTVGEKRPILLLYDGHSTHLGINIIQKAREEKITIMKIPPHTSDNLQPLDIAVNKSFKDKWDVELVKWQRLNVGKVLPNKDFSRIIGQVWGHINPLVCAAGFRKAGIYPLNKNAIPENKFDPILLAEWKRSAKLTKKTNEEMSERPKTSVDQPDKLRKIALASVNKILFEAQVAPQHISMHTISLENVCPISINDVLNKRSQGKDAPLANITNVQQCSKVQILDNQPVITNITFEQLLLRSVKPGILSFIAKRKKVAAGAEVITHDEAYERCKVMEGEKQQKLQKQQEKKVQREKQIQAKEGDSENKYNSIPGPSGLNRKIKNKDKFETAINKNNKMSVTNCKIGKNTGKKSQVSLKENMKNVKFRAKKKYRKRSSSTSVSDCVSLHDDSDIVDLIDEDSDLPEEDFDIIRNLGYINFIPDLENNNITDEKNKVTETVIGSGIRTIQAESVISNITNGRKKATEIVTGSEERKMAAEAVDSNWDEKIEKEGRKEMNYAINNNVMVRYYTRNKWTYYIGYITNIISPHPSCSVVTYEIRFYKTYKNPLKFKLTKKVDRDTVPELSIVKKVHLLQDPKNSNEFLLSHEEDLVYFS